MALLSTMHKLVRPGGLVLIGTQYDWVPNQPGLDNQESGEQVLSAALGTWFDPVLEPQNVEFVKAETSRKFECGTQHLTFWQRREKPRIDAGTVTTRSATTETPTSVTTQEN